MVQRIRITTLVENSVYTARLLAEHGLSFWIEHDNTRILFDTGQSNILIHNAKTLGIDLSKTDAIVLSHGHYDHTGGLPSVLEIAPKAKIYLHPAAVKPKFSRKASTVKSVGIPEAANKALQNHEVFWTESPTEIVKGFMVTGRIPRVNDFENVGGDFYLDKDCHKPDELLDDQALFFDSPKGLIVVLGCGHAGVVNTLNYAAKLSGKKHIYAVMGGMHLLRASRQRIEQTETAFREYNLQKIGLAHCTGEDTICRFRVALPNRCFTCEVGTKIGF